MNLKRFFLFFARGHGAILTVTVLVLGLCFYAGRFWMKRQEELSRKGPGLPMGEGRPRTTVDKGRAPAETTAARDALVPLPAVKPMPLPATFTPRAPEVPEVATLAVYEAPPVPSPAPKAEMVKAAPPEEPRVWLARGIKVPCILLNNLESSWKMEVPVQAEVSRNVYQVCDGVRCLIIPAGTLVSCWASPGAVRDRIQVKGRWSFLYLRDGREATVEGVAAMRQAHPDNLMFGPEDSTPGLQGDVIETDPWANAKAALALILQAGMQTGQTALAAMLQAPRTGLSIQVPDTSSITAKYLDQMLNGLSGDARYVRVPVGTEFYVITASVLEPLKRAPGGDQDRPDQEPLRSAFPRLQNASSGLDFSALPKQLTDALKPYLSRKEAGDNSEPDASDEVQPRYHF